MQFSLKNVTQIDGDYDKSFDTFAQTLESSIDCEQPLTSTIFLFMIRALFGSINECALE